MKQPGHAITLGCLLFTLAGTGNAASAPADAVDSCREEALEYSIPAEELDAYISDCLTSRGELTDGESVDTDYVPPLEMDGLPGPLTGDTNAAQ